MGQDEIFVGVCAVLREKLNIDSSRVSFDTDIVSDLQLDSLGQITLMFELENRFRIYLDPDELTTIRTLGDVVREIARRWKTSASVPEHGAYQP